MLSKDSRGSSRSVRYANSYRHTGSTDPHTRSGRPGGSDPGPGRSSAPGSSRAPSPDHGGGRCSGLRRPRAKRREGPTKVARGIAHQFHAEGRVEELLHQRVRAGPRDGQDIPLTVGMVVVGLRPRLPGPAIRRRAAIDHHDTLVHTRPRNIAPQEIAGDAVILGNLHIAGMQIIRAHPVDRLAHPPRRRDPGEMVDRVARAPLDSLAPRSCASF